jgi:transcriptional regulator with XRE-family HTH domain
MMYLRHIREQRGISQDKLSELSGVPQNTISRIERGERTPRPSTLEKLASVLKVEHPSWLAMNTNPALTFKELIEGPPKRRQTYIKNMREMGRLSYFIKRLEEIYESRMEDSRADPMDGVGHEVAWMLGYAKAMDEGRDAQEKASEE